jgi:lipid-A-disaccharide synthase
LETRLKPLKILLIAGEASADLHAGHLVEKLAEHRELTLIGIGGDQLVRQGLQPIRHAREMAVVGLTEALQKIPQTLRLFRELENLAVKEKPDFVLMLDLPDFNLRLAPRFKRLGIPVIYYISPQVWAWRSGRVKAMADCLDLLLLILPFEPGWYQKNSQGKLRVEYVGHPVTEEIPDLPYQPVDNRIALMPGSRESEWRALFGAMIAAAALMSRADSRLEFHLPVAEPLRQSAFVKECLRADGPFGDSIRSLGAALHIWEKPAHEILREARAAWIASGTATLEAAVVGVPMVVVYKVNAFTAFLFRNFIRYRGPVAMVNLIHCGLGSQERVVPELLQENVEPSRLVSAMREVMADPAWSAQKEMLARTRQLLQGEGHPVANAAQAIERFLGGQK